MRGFVVERSPGGGWAPAGLCRAAREGVASVWWEAGAVCIASVNRSGAGGWGTHGGRQRDGRLSGPALEVIEDLFDDAGILDAGDDAHGPTATAAGLDVDRKDTPEPLCPRHGRMAFDGRAG